MVDDVNSLLDKKSNISQKQVIRRLYQTAFREYGTVALWNMRPVEHPTPADALAITSALRTHGRMTGRQLAEQIEAVCHATD